MISAVTRKLIIKIAKKQAIHKKLYLKKGEWK